MNRLLDWVGVFVCWAAGVYVLKTHAITDNTFVEVIVGLYFIGQGFFVLQSMRTSSHRETLPQSVRDRERAQPQPEAPRTAVEL